MPVHFVAWFAAKRRKAGACPRVGFEAAALICDKKAENLMKTMVPLR